MKFLKQQLSIRTGVTVPQLGCGVYSMHFKSHDCLHKSDYFVKAADSCIVEKACNIKRNKWALNVQKLDGTKASVHVNMVSGDSKFCVHTFRN